MHTMTVRASLHESARQEIQLSEVDYFRWDAITLTCGVPLSLLDLATGKAYLVGWINCGSSYREAVILRELNPLDLLAPDLGATKYERLQPERKTRCRAALANLLAGFKKPAVCA